MCIMWDDSPALSSLSQMSSRTSKRCPSVKKGLVALGEGSQSGGLQELGGALERTGQEKGVEAQLGHSHLCSATEMRMPLEEERRC
jgi:hypothetical protein